MGILRWRGMLESSTERQRLVIALAAMELCVAIVCTQLTFLAIMLPGNVVAYAVILLIPIVVGALLLGVTGGTALGLFAGTAQYVHSLVMPLDFHELALVTPLSPIVPLCAFGILTGMLFALAFRKQRSRREVIVCLAACCLVISLVYTAGFVANAFLVQATGASLWFSQVEFSAVFGGGIPVMEYLPELAVQVVANTIILSIACILTYRVVRVVLELEGDLSLRAAFRASIFFVVWVAFVATATMSYVSVTIEEQNSANAAIRSEVNYLCLQLQSIGARAEAFGRIVEEGDVSPRNMSYRSIEDFRLLSDPIGDVLDGYTMEQTGTVAILKDDWLLATDDKRLPIGSRITILLGEDIRMALDESVRTDALQRILYDGVLSSEERVGGYNQTVQIGWLLARQQGDYTVMIIEPSSMVYQNRAGVIGREAAMTFVLLVAIFEVITRLLASMVAQRIDDTNDVLTRITEGDLDARVGVVGAREMKRLSRGINYTVEALQGWIAEAENRMNSELSAARTIQESTLPSTFPPFPHIKFFDIYAHMEPAREVGGDFYDFFLLGDSDANGGRLVLVVADVSGKGIPAALCMMRAKTLIRDAFDAGLEPGDMAQAVNDVLCESNDAGMFVTAWVGVLEYDTGHIDFVNAGHNPPLLWQGGSWSWMKDRSGLPFGMYEGLSYRTHSIDLQLGDKLVMYTDGVTEAMNTDGKLYGEDCLIEAVEACGDLKPRDLVEAVRLSVKEYAEGAEQSDDITLLAFELKG